MTDELTPFHLAISNLCCTSCTNFPHPPKIFSIPSLAQEIIWVFSHISLIICSLIKPHSFLNPWILATQEWWHFNGGSLEHCLSMCSPRTALRQIWMQIVYLKVNARSSNREIKKWDRERKDTNTICVVKQWPWWAPYWSTIQVGISGRQWRIHYRVISTKRWESWGIYPQIHWLRAAYQGINSSLLSLSPGHSPMARILSRCLP